MPIIVNGIEYINGTEASILVGGSRQSFYSNVKPYLRPYHFGGRKAAWYNKQEVEALASGKPLRKASIAITGIFTNWTEHARSLGYNVETVNRDIELGPLPNDLAAGFNIPADKLFIRRGRMSFVDQQPICYWNTFYPAEFVGDIITQMQSGEASNIVEHIQEKYGLSIGKVKDRYSTRITTLDEQNLFHLLNDEPVLVLQRLSLTKDEKILVLFSDMVLLGSWFIIERSEDVDYWDK